MEEGLGFLEALEDLVLIEEAQFAHNFSDFFEPPFMRKLRPRSGIGFFLIIMAASLTVIMG